MKNNMIDNLLTVQLLNTNKLHYCIKGYNQQYKYVLWNGRLNSAAIVDIIPWTPIAFQSFYSDYPSLTICVVTDPALSL